MSNDDDDNIKNNNLNTYYANIRSVRNKLFFLEYSLSSNKYDIIYLVTIFVIVDYIFNTLYIYHL